uniref:Uncharacterized protein n=1 Tax=Avena sativa TaxID=4498 RepID=A0ACD5XQB8_AVESA
MEAGDEERPLLRPIPPEMYLTQDGDSRYTSDGTVDANGQPAVKMSTGNWRACFFVLGIEFSECLAFFAISKNLVTYLTSVLHESKVDAARNVSSYLDRHNILHTTSWSFLGRHILGKIQDDSDFSLDLRRRDACADGFCDASMDAAILQPRPRPRLPRTLPHGAWQWRHQALHLCLRRRPVRRLGPRGAREEGVLLQLVLLLHQRGSLLSTTVLVWVQDNVGWGVGFAVPLLLMSLGFGVFLAGRRAYRYRRPGERSPMTRVSQVVVAAARNRRLELPHDCSALHHLPPPSEAAGFKVHHTAQFRFLDKAAIVPAPTSGKEGQWRLCTVSQVEEVKKLLRLCPVWASLVVFYMATAQMSSTLMEQGMAMDNRVGRFAVPPASMDAFDVLAMLVLIPVYNAALVPLARRATGEDRGISQPQRISVGLALFRARHGLLGTVSVFRIGLVVQHIFVLTMRLIGYIYTYIIAL